MMRVILLCLILFSESARMEEGAEEGVEGVGGEGWDCRGSGSTAVVYNSSEEEGEGGRGEGGRGEGGVEEGDGVGGEVEGGEVERGECVEWKQRVAAFLGVRSSDDGFSSSLVVYCSVVGNFEGVQTKVFFSRDESDSLFCCSTALSFTFFSLSFSISSSFFSSCFPSFPCSTSSSSSSSFSSSPSSFSVPFSSSSSSSSSTSSTSSSSSSNSSISSSLFSSSSTPSASSSSLSHL